MSLPSAPGRDGPTSIGRGDHLPDVVFLRPRLGVGGSERLVTDAALQLQGRGHRVEFLVPSSRGVSQFPLVAGHQLPVRTLRGGLPETAFGRLRAPLAIGRTLAVASRLTLVERRPVVVFVDVVPHVVPFVKRVKRLPVVYFCHHPDLLLTPDGGRQSFWYRLYRRPLDDLEARGLNSADIVAVNSRFTERTVRVAFPSLPSVKMRVLYPGVAVDASCAPRAPTDGEILLLSIARFDPRKNLELAVEAIASLRDRVAPDVFARLRLVLAGHLDDRLPEARAVVETLRARARVRGVSDHVQFAFSPTESARARLLDACRCVVFTPTAEHFGYVPLEAMAAGRPVVAVNNGGPSETVVDGVTGRLCDPTPAAFAAALEPFVREVEVASAQGAAGREHVRVHFSLESFGSQLSRLVTELSVETQGVVP